MDEIQNKAIVVLKVKLTKEMIKCSGLHLVQLVSQSFYASVLNVLLVPWTKNHLSSFKCGFLNIFSRQNLPGFL